MDYVDWLAEALFALTFLGGYLTARVGDMIKEGFKR